MQKNLCLYLCLIVSVFCLPTYGVAETDVFGPQQVLIKKGKPVRASYRFTADVAQEGMLTVVNGTPDGSQRVSSLVLSLNGTELIASSALNQGVPSLAVPVVLDQVNALKLKVSGSADSLITLTITAIDPPAPAPTAQLTVSPTMITPGETAELTWDTANAETVTLEPGYGIVSPSGGMTVSPEVTQTYTLTAEGGGKSATAQATVIFVPDSPPIPTITLTAEPMQLMEGEPVMLTWQSTNADYVFIQPIEGNFPGSGTYVDYPKAGTHYNYAACRTEDGLCAGDVLMITVDPAPPQPEEILIDDIDGQPAGQAAVSRTGVTISGTVNVNLGNELGVTVGGVVALVDGQRFVANRVPLQEGANLIDIVATAIDGQSVSRSIELYALATDEEVVLSPFWQSGEAPLDLQFRTEVMAADIVTASQLACSGPVTPAVVPVDPETSHVLFEQPGLYECQVSATLASGRQLNDRAGVQVWDRQHVDQLLQTKWVSMKSALNSNNIPDAVSYFSTASRDVFQAQFEQMGPMLPEVVARMGEFKLVEILEDRAIYDMRTSADGVEYSFQVDFIRDEDGIWRLWTF